jgi:hypothetical protein
MILSDWSQQELGAILSPRAEAPVELFINAALIATSVVLFCYWFRYGCLLILAAETAHDYSEEVATANQLAFPEVRAMLRRHDVTDLESLHERLEHDLAIITYLLEHTTRAGFDGCFENAMLKIHYRAMSVQFRLTRHNVPKFASAALEEMSLVVAHSANAMGERSAAAH